MVMFILKVAIKQTVFFGVLLCVLLYSNKNIKQCGIDIITYYLIAFLSIIKALMTAIDWKVSHT